MNPPESPGSRPPRSPMAKPKRPRRLATSKDRRRPPQPTHDFTLVYPGSLEDLTDDGVDALYEAGCDDALVGSSEGFIRIHFDRESPSFRIALISAILDVERSGLNLELIRVEPI